MSGEVSAAGHGDTGDRGVRRKVVLAFVAAGGAVCLGGVAAIVAVSQGASMAISLALMAAVVISGVVPALVFAHRITKVSAVAQPSILEQQLSARYGVPVRRLAFHVWDVNGELVEATFDPATGYLTSGGRQLRL